MNKKILVTGGPVGAKLDPIKIITNRFKGGRMAQLAAELSKEADVIFLCTKDTVHPSEYCSSVFNTTVVYHNGFHDYMKKVCEISQKVDAVILGAAVANMIPVKLYTQSMGLPGIDKDTHQISAPVPLPLEDKFPSHNYKPGDSIFMEWTIAPRIIDMVKDHMPKHGHLFGFKLLSGQPHEELIRAAYEVLLESRATAVIANDPSVGLDTKHIVTKERGVHTIDSADLAKWILNVLEDEYYRTESVYSKIADAKSFDMSFFKLDKILDKYRDRFIEVENGMKFGTAAWRVADGGFVTTGRGKRELDERAYVSEVDHKNHVVYIDEFLKATLNAPLLDHIFNHHGNKVQGIVHLHEQIPGLPTYPWAPPGTVRDSLLRPCNSSFNIEGHGCFLLLDKEGNEI